LWSDNDSDVNVDDPGNLHGRFYLRFNVDDEPGVLARIAGLLGENGISIASVFQHDSVEADESGVPVVIMTQKAPEGAAQNAVQQIAQMESVSSNFERLRILD
ncbi:MAG: ACT domain-containing protein, partial [Planctomycetota bacterium]